MGIDMYLGVYVEAIEYISERFFVFLGPENVILGTCLLAEVLHDILSRKFIFPQRYALHKPMVETLQYLTS